MRNSPHSFVSSPFVSPAHYRGRHSSVWNPYERLFRDIGVNRSFICPASPSISNMFKMNRSFHRPWSMYASFSQQSLSKVSVQICRCV